MNRLIRIILFCIALPAAGQAAGATDDYTAPKRSSPVKAKRTASSAFGIAWTKSWCAYRATSACSPGRTCRLARQGWRTDRIVQVSRPSRRHSHPRRAGQQRPAARPDLLFRPDKARRHAGLAWQPAMACGAACRRAAVPVVERGEKRFVLTADGDEGLYMDESFAAAAEPLAMRLVLPVKACNRCGRTRRRDPARRPGDPRPMPRKSPAATCRCSAASSGATRISAGWPTGGSLRGQDL